MAIGVHDWVMTSHDHQPNAPEKSIVQVWSSDLVSQDGLTPAPLPVIWVCCLALLCLALIEEEIPSVRPWVRESFPRPPNLFAYLFRGPPHVFAQGGKNVGIGETKCHTNLQLCSSYGCANSAGPSRWIGLRLSA
jgi:hypothetical protein